jgi:hypothetical protein
VVGVIDPDLIDGKPLPPGTYEPWIKPLNVQTGNDLTAHRFA